MVSVSTILLVALIVGGGAIFVNSGGIEFTRKAKSNFVKTKDKISSKTQKRLDRENES